MVLIRRTGGAWESPEVAGHPDERALQDIVKRSPSLLPGGSDDLAVVDELSVPGAGFADIVAVGVDGRIVVVECKLRSNPEIRREVVGQILAYASGLWRMTYEAFDAAFTARFGGSSLADAVSSVAADAIDVEAFRAAVTANLRSGAFRLIVAVDLITPELRSIIEYLNDHSTDNVQVLALELEYARHGDLELLTPHVYGEEAADRKQRTAAGSKWNEATFAEQMNARASGAELEFLETLLAHGTTRGHHPYYGTGITPGMSYWYSVAGKPTSTWSLYLNENGSSVTPNIGALNGKAGEEYAQRLLDALRRNPVLALRLANVSLNQYPSLPVAGLLTDPIVADAFFVALDSVID